MFESFFPKPKLFFLSVLAWTVVAVLVWYLLGDQLAAMLGFELPEESEPVIGLGYFVTPEFMWFYAFIAFFVVTFAAFWFITSPHPWQWWSVVGSAVILFSTYFSVQVSVALNHWRRPFFDLLQSAFDSEKRGSLEAKEFFDLMLIFAQIAFVWVIIYVITRFLTSHYVFRWRTAMNDFYMSKWKKVRHIEGASQRVQEDTMRFADIVESLGIAIVDSIMTLFAFLPLLWALSVHVTELPLIGSIPAPLVIAAILWAAFGTTLLAVVGIKLPGLKFKNQRVEAAYRKELVYGEDNEEAAQPATVAQLFNNVRKNYFRIFFHFTYFNIARSFYLQADSLFTYILMIPTIVAGAASFTYGIFQQILTAFGQVSNSFQFLVNSWTTIIELLSIRKRLVAFEAAIDDKPLPQIDQDFMSTGAER